LKNRKLITNIRKAKNILRVHTNGGPQVSTHMGYVKNFGRVWFNKNSLANILSMAEVRNVCRITMDTSVEPAMNVHKMDGTIMKLVEFVSGLYYFNTSAPMNQERRKNTLFSILSVETKEDSQKSKSKPLTMPDVYTRRLVVHQKQFLRPSYPTTKSGIVQSLWMMQNEHC
jgi:hypothetical protein